MTPGRIQGRFNFVGLHYIRLHRGEPLPGASDDRYLPQKLGCFEKPGFCGSTPGIRLAGRQTRSSVDPAADVIVCIIFETERVLSWRHSEGVFGSRAVRVCFLCNQIAAWGKIGGFGTNLRRLGGALVQAGVEVHVVVPRRRGQGRVERLDGMLVHGQSWSKVFFGTQLYREIDADLYHVQEPNICGYWARRAMPDRVHLVTSMDPRDATDRRMEFQNATWSRRLKTPVQRFYEDGPLVRRAVAAADGVYVEAGFLREKARRLYSLAELPGVLPKPIPIPAGPFVKAERPLCVFLARFDPRKRPLLFFQLARRMPDVDFIAVGQAHDRAYQKFLESQIAGIANLTVTGLLDPFANSRMFDILSRAWVLVHPAAREGLPTAFQEASVHEAAILAEVDPDGYVSRFGRVVPPGGDLAQWEESLRALLESCQCGELGRAGREWNRSHHAVDVSLTAHLDAYRSHLESRSFSHVSAPLNEENREEIVANLPERTS